MTHITPLLVRLHCLPVKFRIMYKVATLAFRKFHDGLPDYLSELLQIENPVRNTRSSCEKRLKPPPFGEINPQTTECSL